MTTNTPDSIVIAIPGPTNTTTTTSSGVEDSFTKKRDGQRSRKKKREKNSIEIVLLIIRPLLVLLIVVLFIYLIMQTIKGGERSNCLGRISPRKSNSPSVVVQGEEVVSTNMLPIKQDLSLSAVGSVSLKETSAKPDADVDAGDDVWTEAQSRTKSGKKEYDGIYIRLIQYRSYWDKETYENYKNDIIARCENPKTNKDINRSCATGSPLVHAIVVGLPFEIIEILVTNGANVSSIKEGIYISSPPIMWAIARSRWDVVEYLLSIERLDLTTRNDGYQTVVEFMNFNCCNLGIPPLIKERITEMTKKQLVDSNKYGLRDMFVFGDKMGVSRCSPEVFSQELERQNIMYSLISISIWNDFSDTTICRILEDPSFQEDWDVYVDEKYILNFEGLEDNIRANFLKFNFVTKFPSHVKERIATLKALYDYSKSRSSSHLASSNQAAPAAVSGGRPRRNSVSD